MASTPQPTELIPDIMVALLFSEVFCQIFIAELKATKLILFLSSNTSTYYSAFI